MRQSPEQLTWAAAGRRGSRAEAAAAAPPEAGSAGTPPGQRAAPPAPSPCCGSPASAETPASGASYAAADRARLVSADMHGGDGGGGFTSQITEHLLNSDTGHQIELALHLTSARTPAVLDLDSVHTSQFFYAASI